MQLEKKMLEALNEQIKGEFYSHNVYLSMAAYFELKELKGFGQWLRGQAKEELEHGMKIFNYIIDRDGNAQILEIQSPKQSWKSFSEVFEDALSHEEKVTKMINELYENAVLQKDHATKIFLEWFVTEQVEEEATAREILEKVRIAQASKEGLLFLDSEMGKRK